MTDGLFRCGRAYVYAFDEGACTRARGHEGPCASLPSDRERNTPGPNAADRARITRVDELPAFPCGWATPRLHECESAPDPGAHVIVWNHDDDDGEAPDGTDGLVMTSDEARGIARRLIELADEADARKERAAKEKR